MNCEKVDLLIQYALAVASREDDFRDRNLRPIHLIKYVYLADLAYAERKGETFTGVSWQFYKFGPWSVDVYSRIEPALNAVHATKRTYPSDYGDGDFTVWFLNSTEVAEEIERKIPAIPMVALRNSVHNFTNDTAALLHYSYLTPPMLNAAPGEYLDLASTYSPQRPKEEPILQGGVELSKKAQKRRQEKILAIRQEAKNRLAEKRLKRSRHPVATPPRYDDVFFEGQEWIDSLAGAQIEPVKGEVRFTPDIWKSETRSESDVS